MTSAVVPLAYYCERSGPGFWAEPLNALSNLAFLVAALLIVLRTYRLAGPIRHQWDLWLLALLAAGVGAGSFLWHTLRTPWSQWADIVPILLFINVFLASFLVRVGGVGALGTAVGLVFYNTVNVSLQLALPAGLLNGSVLYAPTWVALVLIAVWTGRRDGSAARGLWIATFAFTLSLVLRTVDRAVCGAFPDGTHFGWHLLNGVVLYAAASALVRRPAASAG